MRSEGYQLSLIFLSVMVTALFGVFLWRELFPEYRIYQDTYVELEQLKANEEGGVPAPFTPEVKQIVLTREDKGPEVVDRCVSCHVAMKLSHFSPTKIAKDVNGNTVRDSEGRPMQVPNENYVWTKLDNRIAHLREMGEEGDAERLEELRQAEVGEVTYDMRKVLAMHPLLGREERPFQYHPVEEYGCTSCHNGNGRGLVTDKAHGPVFDGHYEEAAMGPELEFIEKDPLNDPPFASVFNHKPGHELLFQTTPLFVGELMQSQCMQCHQNSDTRLEGAMSSIGSVTREKENQVVAIQKGMETDRAALKGLLELRQSIREGGVKAASENLRRRLEDMGLDSEERKHLESRLQFVQQLQNQTNSDVLNALKGEMVAILGSEQWVDQLEGKVAVAPEAARVVDQFLEDHRAGAEGSGAYFSKAKRIEDIGTILSRVEGAVTPLQLLKEDSTVFEHLSLETDRMTAGYKRGKELFVSQACYACHRIAGFSRGGVGPELTEAGRTYPWFLKESIVWPQADLKSSTMPNFRLDPVEVEALMSFLLAQKGSSQALAESTRKAWIKSWEAGTRVDIEKPMPAADIQDVRKAQVVFATQGCSACHKLKGFPAGAGYSVEKGTPSYDELAKEKEWFRHLFPENVAGSLITQALMEHGEELDQRLASDVHAGGIVDEIDQQYPELIKGLYSSFRFAERARNHEFEEMAAKDPKAAEEAKRHWEERLNRVLHVYIQEYGLGRDIGPRLHWSGVYRDTEWLVGHFRNPGSHSAKSLMPVLPFDDSKFYALTHLLQVLGRQNRDEIRQVWDRHGFSPQEAYETHCAVCHGEFLRGNGVVAEWIYPIPKNLKDATFLRNLTKAQAIASITHGVRGGPMPPWGEAPVDSGEAAQLPVLSQSEIEQLVDWLYSSLPGGRVIKGEEDVPKWHYTPKDVFEGLKKEGGLRELLNSGLQSSLSSPLLKEEAAMAQLATQLPTGEGLYVALEPRVQEVSGMDIFDRRSNPVTDAPEKDLYFIKKKFYTPQNLAEGKRLFIANCSHCHGKEGAGNGQRAAAMEEAKPRMLSNLPWLSTRDDMRLLRAMYYGVPGTAMTPWGDKTNNLQRIQIAMYIRSLSAERKMREDLFSALFKSFEEEVIKVDEARAKHSAEVEALQERFKAVAQRRMDLYQKAQTGNTSSAPALAAYSEELELVRRIQAKQGIDQILESLVKSLKEEKGVLEHIGSTFIQRQMEPELLKQYLAIIHELGGRVQLGAEGLAYSFDLSHQQELDKQKGTLLAALEQKLTQLESQKEALSGKLPSPERTEQLQDLDEKLKAIKGLEGLLVSGLRKGEQLRENQKQIFEKYVAQRG